MTLSPEESRHIYINMSMLGNFREKRNSKFSWINWIYSLSHIVNSTSFDGM